MGLSKLLAAIVGVSATHIKWINFQYPITLHAHSFYNSRWVRLAYYHMHLVLCPPTTSSPHQCMVGNHFIWCTTVGWRGFSKGGGYTIPHHFMLKYRFTNMHRSSWAMVGFNLISLCNSHVNIFTSQNYSLQSSIYCHANCIVKLGWTRPSPNYSCAYL